MAELVCGAKSCVYNQDRLCCKGDIMVGGKHADSCEGTCCESFMEMREGRDSFRSATEHASRLISIDCEAVKCRYNSNYKCTADKVDIEGGNACHCRETSCKTFSER